MTLVPDITEAAANAAGAGRDTVVRRAREAASSGDNAQITAAARDIEGLFLKMMFEEMAKTVDREASLVPRSPGQDLYEEWFRGEVATEMARRGGMGLGDMIARSLGATPISAPRAAEAYRKASGASLSIPVDGVVTSPVGVRIGPFTGRPERHTGMDIAVPEGSPVRCPLDGTVTVVGRDERGGLAITVRHRDGYTTGYAHLSESLVNPGDTVAAGQTIAKSGDSGRSTGPHLHFSVKRHGRPVDPSRWSMFR